MKDNNYFLEMKNNELKNENERLYQVVEGYKEMCENYGEYIDYLEEKVRNLCHWQKTIIDLHENREEGLDNLITDLEDVAEQRFSEFCK